MKIVKIIGEHQLSSQLGKVYFAKVVNGFAVFYSDIDPFKVDLLNHRWSVFRAYDEVVAANIFEAWRNNRV